MATPSVSSFDFVVIPQRPYQESHDFQPAPWGIAYQQLKSTSESMLPPQFDAYLIRTPRSGTCPVDVERDVASDPRQTAILPDYIPGAGSSFRFGE